MSESRSASFLRFSLAYTIVGVLATLVLLLPEATEHPTHYRVIYSIWATTALLIPTVVAFFFSDVDIRARHYWRMFYTGAFLCYVIHFYYAVFATFGGFAGTIQGQGPWIAWGNFLLSLIWAVDVLLVWCVTRQDYRIWSRHFGALLIILLAVLFFAVVRNEGVVRWIGIALFLALVGSIVARYFCLAKIRNRVGKEPSNSPQETYFRGSKSEELAYFSRFVRQINHVQRRIKQQSFPSGIRRAFHAKQHVGVKNATLTVSSDIPSDLREGPFGEPKKEYEATIRFSNAAGTIQSDFNKDLRGFALRLHLDENNAHDFLATNAPASHARDAYQFMAVAISASKRFRILFPLRLLFWVGLYETLRILWVLVRSRSRVPSVFAETYWSRSPIKMQNTAVRYTFAPRNKPVDSIHVDRPNFLQAEARQQLKQGNVEFDLLFQRFVDEKRTPIEDSSIEWNTAVSPPVKVATILIQKQDLGTARTDAIEAEVDAMDFNPWRTSEELRPLGSQNRARQAVYKSSADFRLGRKQSEMPPWYVELPMLVLEPLFRFLNSFIPWYRMPLSLLEIANLDVLRRDLRNHNLIDPLESSGLVPNTAVDDFDVKKVAARQSDGTYNDLTDTSMGKAGSIFGRNMPLHALRPPTEDSVLTPNPRHISNTLLARDSFQPATTLNILAAAWIQFQVHGWFNHTKLDSVFNTESFWEIPLDDDDPWRKLDNVMRIPKTNVARKTQANIPVFENTETHWWDASQIYGNNDKETSQLREKHLGYLKIEGDLLPIDPRLAQYADFDLTGFNDNYWVGLSLFHTIFVKEHNAICDHLVSEFPGRKNDSDWLFQKARLINAALMAKIHTVEWTPGILGRKSLLTGMRSNWWGFLGEQFKETFGRVSESEEISGIIGSYSNHHAAPYSLTEDFVTVYRMHPLIPDNYLITSVDGKKQEQVLQFYKINAGATRKVMKKHRQEDLWYSLGIAHPGAIALKNYPNALRRIVVNDGKRLDLGTIDILRDRERALPKYNDFRRHLRMKPIRRWKDITADQEIAEQIKDIYGGNLEQVDTMVGLHAETPPPGFGFSDTAFRIFILMASRRLKSDRFYTNHYNVSTYTKPGLDWIRDNLMTEVLLRHFPQLQPALEGVGNAFAPWKRLIHADTKVAMTQKSATPKAHNSKTKSNASEE